MPLKTADRIYEETRQRIASATADIPDGLPIRGWDRGPPPGLAYAIFRLSMGEVGEELYYKSFASKLSGFALWTGRELTEDDVPELAETFPEVDTETFDVTKYNPHVSSADLEQWAIGQGLQGRIPAKYATGEVRVYLRTETTIRAGTRFETGGQRSLGYLADDDYRPASGETSLTVGVEAEFGGDEYNVPAGAVNTVPSQPLPTAEIEAVSNSRPIAGGEAPETDPELRERGRRALEFNADGPTEQGIEGALYRTYEGLELDDIAVVPYRDPTAAENELGYPYADVVVDGGGTDAEIQAFLDDWAFPVLHRLVRPTRHPIAVTATLRPSADATVSDVNTERAENAVLRWLAEFGIGESLSTSKLQAIIHNADPEDIGDIDDLVVTDQETGTTLPPGSDLDSAIAEYDKVVPATADFSVEAE